MSEEQLFSQTELEASAFAVFVVADDGSGVFETDPCSNTGRVPTHVRSVNA